MVISREEINAVMNVLKSGELSTFSTLKPNFLGGKTIKEFEKRFAEYHNSKYAIAVNSGTAALHAAIAACGIGPGDEVIVPPYTFTSTATSVLMHNAIPIFADIDKDSYCLDPNEIRKAITPRTKAIIPVHLLGHPADMDGIMEIAKRHKLNIIEDAAQAIGAKYKGRLVGTIGDIGCFSFQEKKDVATGEGGMIITNDLQLAERCRMIRNHGEVIVEGKKREYLSNILGWNYRMTEMEAAIGIVQLKKLNKLNDGKIKLAKFLSKNLRMNGVKTPHDSKDIKHVYHLYAIEYDENKVGIPIKDFSEALKAEGIPNAFGYPHPLYKNPLFREKIVYGNQGCPFNCSFYKGSLDYKKCNCKVAEELCKKAIWFSVARPPATIDDMKDVVNAIKKIIENKSEFR
ncbi:MAG: DegT/DnrJ/EryC1/StrS family aminotransferase [Candidatus Aenigmatarchaeota archaeon]